MPCGLNLSSPIILFKAASTASRSFFWLVPKLRRGRRPVVVAGKVRLAFIADAQADLPRSEKVALYQILYNCRPLSSRECVQSGNQQRAGFCRRSGCRWQVGSFEGRCVGVGESHEAPRFGCAKAGFWNRGGKGGN